jgi:hypothetical protein
METKKGGFKKKLDSFPQTSLNFVGISTVVCGSFWGEFVLPIPILLAYLVPLDVDVTGNTTAKLCEL